MNFRTRDGEHMRVFLEPDGISFEVSDPCVSSAIEVSLTFDQTIELRDAMNVSYPKVSSDQKGTE